MANYDCYEVVRTAEYSIPVTGAIYSSALSGGASYVPPETETETETTIPTPAAITTIPPESYDYELTASKRWDQLSMEFFGTYDRILDLMDANPHISLADKKALYLPIGTKILLPTEEIESESSAIGAASWRA